MTKALGEHLLNGLRWASNDLTNPLERRIQSLQGEEAQKVYDFYKDAGRNVLSYIVEDMGRIALITPHQFPGVTYRWQNQEVRDALAEAGKYGKAVEDVVFIGIDRADRYASLGSKVVSFLSTDEFKNLLAQYHANIPVLRKMVENIASGNKNRRIPKMHVFSQQQVQNLFAQKERDAEQIAAIVNAFSNEIYHYGQIEDGIASALCSYFHTEDATKLDAIMKSLHPLRGTAFFEQIKRNEISLKEIEEITTFIGEQGFIPTPSLIVELYRARDHDAKDRTATISEWKQTAASFSAGRFDATNTLHRSLEYTRFREFVDHEKVKKYIKNHFSYEDYEKIFANSSAQEQALSSQDAFEVACVAHEAQKLYDFILQVKQRADKQGRKVVVVPNFSYGYLPVAPLVPHLEAEGIEVLIGCKVGSTESHDNKEVMNSRLFKGRRRKFMEEQPIIIVVDGTQHLVDRGTENTAARYPDAYQGYLNQVIAMNDANGLRREEYASLGKTEEDMKKLRASEEFQRTVAVYKGLAVNNEQKPYHFGLWNTAEVPLIIRNYHQKLVEMMPVNPAQIYKPTMIFCNVGVLDEQIPQELKQQYPEHTHTPAYYDDCGRIIAFDYGFDNFGVRYLNRLETKVKEAFEAQNGNQEVSLDVAPAIMHYLSKARTIVPEEMHI
ncbi:hypothetical protein HZA99_01470 [Candidatus Woesearchaeota archaeon]|nr:hypothetical protein [Candidatus Woesearchaeota archaeon]